MSSEIMQKSGKLFLIILLPIIIYLFSFATKVYDIESYEKFGLNEDAKAVTAELLEYYKTDDYSAPKFEIFTESENSHLRDVKLILRRTITFFIISLLLFVILLQFVAEKQKVFFYGSILGIALPAVLYIVPFDALFDVFHTMTFAGNWMFPVDSILVNIYTAEFFQRFLQGILLDGLLFSAIILLISYVGNPLRGNH